MLLLASVLLAGGRAAVGQGGAVAPVWGAVSAGGELDTYLRVLQSLGIVPLAPWGARAFSPGEIARLAPPDSGHPWAGRYDWRRSSRSRDFALLRPTASLRFNSGFPYGANDGAVWAGRGLTSAIEAGFAVRYGALSLTVAPLVFRAENADFQLLARGDTGRLAFADGVHGGAIDLPQRFGAAPYTAVDPGQSTLRLDARGAALGLSTANEYWGPAREYPILLGNNAAGFPHVFFGTAAPLDLRVVRLHGRLVWGRLAQSDYSPAIGTAQRFGAGAVAVLTSRFVPGLEIGVARFAHMPWRSGGPTLKEVLVPLGWQYRANITGTITDNQLASAFFRWVLPRSGFEAYGEYGRDDYNQNVRDLVLEPDHMGGYTVGFAKALRSAGTVRVIRAEIQNLQFSVLALGRGWDPFYTNAYLRQGHTQRGQVLGSDAGLGGAGSLAALDTYHPGGRWTVSWSRVLRRQRGGFALDSVSDPQGLDVIHAVSANGLVFRGRYEIIAGLTAVYELNRDFQRDAFNLNLVVGAKVNVP